MKRNPLKALQHIAKPRHWLLQDLSEALADVLFAEGWLRTCMNCDNIDKKTERCKLWPQEPIPPSVAVKGCNKHTDIEEIPF